jgi:NmrA-like family
VVVTGDVTDPASLPATTDVDVVVSALQGGPDVIAEGQIALAEAAARHGVWRFVPSDFAIDLFAAREGAPQFAMRREADRVIDALPMQVAHVLNGGFMDMMLDPSTPGLIDVGTGTVTLWGTGEEPFNLTTVDDTARFTARLATDPADVSGIRYLSGAETTFNAIAGEIARLTGITLTRNILGSADDLRRIVENADDPWSVVMQWYLLSMITLGPFPSNDNDRYPDARPTGLHEYLAAAHRAAAHRAAAHRAAAHRAAAHRAAAHRALAAS